MINVLEPGLHLFPPSTDALNLTTVTTILLREFLATAILSYRLYVVNDLVCVQRG